MCLVLSSRGLLREMLLQVDPRILVQPRKDLGIHPGHAVGSLLEPLPVRVLTRVTGLPSRFAIRIFCSPGPTSGMART